jgi:putative transposase
MLQDRFGISERWACRVVGQHRSTQRHQPDPVDADAALRALLREFSAQRPRWGYRRAHVRLGQLGYEVNRKRVQRLWREEGLRVAARRRQRQRLGESTVPAGRLRAERPDHVWAIDFQFDQTADGRVLKLLNIVDEFTREALAMHVARRIDADQTVAVLDGLANVRGAPAHVRCDNGPELTGAPWQNPYVESFNARVRDELLNVEQFSCLAEATVVINDWRQDYNAHRPHSALANQTPDAFARAWWVRSAEPAMGIGIVS